MSMKTVFITIQLMLGLIVTSSCTKVIDVNLNSNDPQYVIEGAVTLGETTHQLKISKTLNIAESITFPTVDNAIVVLSDDLGNSHVMTLVAPGIYQASNFNVSEGRTYSVSVTIDSKNFKASGTIPQNVTIDTLTSFPFNFGPSSINAIVPVRHDIAGIHNYYQFNLFEKGRQKKGVFIQTDDYNDGNIMLEPIFADSIDNGDTITVEMYCIDKPVYKYFYTLLQNINGSIPANPTSNFSGGCLGYFSARTKCVKQVVIP
jgi:hypothetical protein